MEIQTSLRLELLQRKTEQEKNDDRIVQTLSLSDLFWLPVHASCLLYYSSLQSCTVRAATLRVRHFLPKPLEEFHRCSSSVCDHFVRDLARVPLPLTVTVQHKLLPRANVSRMYAECFDKVLYHVNSRILKCKMTNVITRILQVPIIFFHFFIPCNWFSSLF